MKMLFTDKPVSILRNSRGQAAVLLGMTLVFLMAFTGLSIDLARIFIQKSRLRSAVDAGTLAGLTALVARVSEGGDADTSRARAEEAARKMTAFNMIQMGLATGSVDDVSSTVTATSVIDNYSRAMTIKVNASVDVSTIFLGLIRTPNPPSRITTEGEARRNSAIVSIVLDRSGSMSGAKMANLKVAAKAFVDTFQDNLDQLAVTTFHARADIIHPMAVLTGAGPNSKAAIKAKIDAINAGGTTNLSHGIVLGRTSITDIINADPVPARSAVEALVIMTDGAPTALRGSWFNPRLGVDPHLAANGPGGTYVYDAVYFDRLLDEGGNRQLCGPGDPNYLIASCLNDFSYLDSMGVQQGKNPDGSVITDLSVDGPSEIDKEFYDLTVVEAEYTKDFRNPGDPTDTGITIYTIGLGAAAAAGADPYQNVENQGSIKSFLLRKVANDPLADGDPAFPGQGRFNPSQQAGEYFETPTPAELINIFLEIARRIQLRVIK